MATNKRNGNEDCPPWGYDPDGDSIDNRNVIDNPDVCANCLQLPCECEPGEYFPMHRAYPRNWPQEAAEKMDLLAKQQAEVAKMCELIAKYPALAIAIIQKSKGN